MYGSKCSCVCVHIIILTVSGLSLCLYDHWASVSHDSVLAVAAQTQHTKLLAKKLKKKKEEEIPRLKMDVMIIFESLMQKYHRCFYLSKESRETQKYLLVLSQPCWVLIVLGGLWISKMMRLTNLISISNELQCLFYRKIS